MVYRSPIVPPVVSVVSVFCLGKQSTLQTRTPPPQGCHSTLLFRPTPVLFGLVWTKCYFFCTMWNAWLIKPGVTHSSFIFLSLPSTCAFDREDDSAVSRVQTTAVGCQSPNSIVYTPTARHSARRTMNTARGKARPPRWRNIRRDRKKFRAKRTHMGITYTTDWLPLCSKSCVLAQSLCARRLSCSE